MESPEKTEEMESLVKRELQESREKMVFPDHKVCLDLLAAPVDPDNLEKTVKT